MPRSRLTNSPSTEGETNGVVTYWLLDSLKQLSPGLSYKTLHDRILAKVHGQFEAQTPQLEGEGSRQVFGSDRVEPAYAAPVLEVDVSAGRLRINAGQAQLVRRGARFAIYPSGTEDFDRTEKRLALADVREAPGAVETWATITRTFIDIPSRRAPRLCSSTRARFRCSGASA